MPSLAIARANHGTSLYCPDVLAILQGCMSIFGVEVQMRYVKRLALSVFALLWLGVGGIVAAEFTVVERRLSAEIAADALIRGKPEPRGRICNVRLAGSIIAGDLQRMNLAFNRVAGCQADGDQTLCLDSSGGSFPDALAIAKSLLESACVSTHIQAGAKCEAECGIIFMAGSSEVGRVNTPYRTLHSKGRLAFRALFDQSVFEPGRQFTKDELLGALDTARSRTKEVISAFSHVGSRSGRTWLRPGLLSGLMDLKPGEMLVIDSSSRAKEWGIDWVTR